MADAGSQPADEVLPNLAILWFEKLWTERDIISVIFGTAQTNPEVGAELRQVIQEGVTLLADYVRARLQQGELRVDLPVEIAALMFFASPMFSPTRPPGNTTWSKPWAAAWPRYGAKHRKRSDSL